MSKDYEVDPDMYWIYPKQELPPMGRKLALLTQGGIQVTGTWPSDGSCIAWQRLFKRDHDYEHNMTHKVILYECGAFEVPAWAKYIAADSTGEVHVYEDRPHLSDDGYEWCPKGKSLYLKEDITSAHYSYPLREILV